MKEKAGHLTSGSPREPLISGADSQDVLQERSQESKANRAKLCLYVAHALSTWGERAWEFSIGLLALKLSGGSLRLVSLYGLAASIGLVAFSGRVGSFVDKTPRFRAVTTFYILQNVSLALAAASALFLLIEQSLDASGMNVIKIAATINLVFWGVASSVGQAGSALSIEKEWSKAMCRNDEEALARMNSTLRTIDLSCQVLAPVLSGFLMTFVGMKVAVFEIAGFNILAWAPEIFLVRLAQSYAPQLKMKLSEGLAPELMEGEESKPTGNHLRAFFGPIAAYYRQKCSLAMFALAFLYLTVLSLGILMTSYLKWKGMMEATLSVYRGCGALSGVLGARMYPWIHKKLGLGKSAYVGISIQFLSLLIAVAPSLLVKLGVDFGLAFFSIHVLVIGLVVSRFGLWLFDLSISQTIQTTVDPDILGSISGAQKFHENLFSVILYAMCASLSDPEYFVWLMMASLAVVGSSLGLFSVYYNMNCNPAGRTA